MEPKQPRNSDTGQPLKGHGHDSKDGDVEGEMKDESEKMILLEKLMLSAALWGNEACTDFEHLYTMPVLQTLGLPLSLASMTGLVAGFSAALLLPVLGWLSDRGSNPHRRKIIVTIFVCWLLIGGMLCVIVANFLHLSYLLDYNATVPNISSAFYTTSFTPDPSVNMYYNTSNAKEWNGSSLEHNMNALESMDLSLSDSAKRSMSPVMTDFNEASSEVPFKAGLALLGFILVDIGFDGCNACIKSYVLTCGTRSEHTSLLVIGLIMASAGGVSTAALGVVDFTSMLGLTDIQGARLTIQTTVQGIVAIIFVLLGLPITLITGRRRLRLQTISVKETLPNSESSEDRIHREEQFCRSILSETFENSIRSFGGGAVHFDQNLVLLEEHHNTLSQDPKPPQHTPTEYTPLLAVDEVLKEDEGTFERSHFTSFSTSFADKDSVSSFPTRTTTSLSTLEDLPEDKVADFSRQASGSVGNFKLKILLLTVAIYFSTSVLFLFSLTSSDYVGKAIYCGDPEALPGSDSLAKYQEGVRMASWGFFTCYASFLTISFVHPKLLALLGHRLEFVLVHLLMTASLLILTLTVRLEVYFVLTVIAGLQRACFFVVPFAVTNDLVQSMGPAEGDGKSRIGFTMSAVTAAMTVAYCTLYTWIGPLEDMTGQPAVPFWVASCSGLISASAFVAVGKV